MVDKQYYGSSERVSHFDRLLDVGKKFEQKTS